jgi:hypothetical protein
MSVLLMALQRDDAAHTWKKGGPSSAREDFFQCGCKGGTFGGIFVPRFCKPLRALELKPDSNPSPPPLRLSLYRYALYRYALLIAASYKLRVTRRRHLTLISPR